LAGVAVGEQKEARYYHREQDRVVCELCPHHCRLGEGKLGLCHVRKAEEGRLWTLNYGRVSSLNLDPIEKKPLFHFHPGSSILSLGTVGCNLACRFCQNWEISQGNAPTQPLSPEQAVMLAKRERGNLGVCYTYNEPFIWFEYVLDTARLAREAGLKNVLVTNGYVEEEPRRELLPHLDAMNVDVKSMRDEFYERLCRAKASPPRRTVEAAKEAGCWVEVTNLLIPGWNDREEEIGELVDWVAAVDAEMPLHFSRYHPAYKLTEPATPLATLERARSRAMEKLKHVYIGNVWGRGGEDTVCPGCGRSVIERRGFQVLRQELNSGRCAHCGRKIAGRGI
jgi:pyruvate formate lyase activating enzyme